MAYIPVNQPVLLGNERKYLLECIDSGWISSEGPFIRRFEEDFATRVGRKHGIAVSNGSVALDTAIQALKLESGSQVILPTFTIISCIAAVVRAGLEPILVDCDPVTWNMDPNQVAAKITDKTSAIMVVHIYGLPVDMKPVLELAERYGLRVIEDAAQMHGQTYRGAPCGSFGDISTFSFYANKHITTGEGGMVVTNDSHLAERCRSIRNLCFQVDRRFVHEELGYNFRMTNLQAAIGLAQLEQLDQFVVSKRSMGKRYRESLDHVDSLKQPLEKTDYAENIYWVYGMLIDDQCPLDARTTIQRLEQLGVGSRPFFFPMHEQPLFRKKGMFRGETYPHAETIARKGFYIPSGLALTQDEIDFVAGNVKEVFK